VRTGRTCSVALILFFFFFPPPPCLKIIAGGNPCYMTFFPLEAHKGGCDLGLPLSLKQWALFFFSFLLPREDAAFPPPPPLRSWLTLDVSCDSVTRPWCVDVFLSFFSFSRKKFPRVFFLLFLLVKFRREYGWCFLKAIGDRRRHTPFPFPSAAGDVLTGFPFFPPFC